MKLSSKILTLLLVANLANSIPVRAEDPSCASLERLSEIVTAGALGVFTVGLVTLDVMFTKDMIEEAIEDYYYYYSKQQANELRKNINDFLQFGYPLPYYHNHDDLIQSFKFEYNQTIRYLEQSHLPDFEKKALRSLIHKIYKAKKMILADYAIKSTHITRSEKNMLINKINIYLFALEKHLTRYGKSPHNTPLRYVPSDLEKAVDTLVWDLRLKAQLYDDHEKIVINAFGGLYQEIINTIYQYVAEQKYDKAQERFNAFCSKLHIPHRSLGLALH